MAEKIRIMVLLLKRILIITVLLNVTNMMCFSQNCVYSKELFEISLIPSGNDADPDYKRLREIQVSIKDNPEIQCQIASFDYILKRGRMTIDSVNNPSGFNRDNYLRIRGISQKGDRIFFTNIKVNTNECPDLFEANPIKIMICR